MTKSAIWSLGISVPVSLFGMWAGPGIIHFDSPLFFLPFLPAIGVLMLFGSTGPLPINSEAIILTLSFMAQILGYFVGVLAVRTVYDKTLGKTQKKHFWE